jgi:hypothetical protein
VEGYSIHATQLPVVLLVGAVASVAGGVLGGILTGGKALGTQLAAMMGSFYGPLAGICGIALGLVALAVVA